MDLTRSARKHSLEVPKVVVPKNVPNYTIFGIETHGFGDPLFLKTSNYCQLLLQETGQVVDETLQKRRITAIGLARQGSGHVRVRVPPLKQHCNIYPVKNVRIQLPSGAIRCQVIQFWV